MAQIPPSTQQKTERQRREAPLELPKTRLCANVISTFMSGESSLDAALKALQDALGSKWGVVLAFQFMSGRQALFAAECAEGQERSELIITHNVARAASGAGVLTRVDLAAIRAVCVTAAAKYRAEI